MKYCGNKRPQALAILYGLTHRQYRIIKKNRRFTMNVCRNYHTYTEYESQEIAAQICMPVWREEEEE